MREPLTIDPALFRASRTAKESAPSSRRLAPLAPSAGPIGVTLVTPRYAHLVDEAVTRFTKHSGLDVLVLHASEECGFAAKLNLDLLIAPRPIVFFDADLWLLRDFDFAEMACGERFCAASDPCAFNSKTFCGMDCSSDGWDPATYFNSGLFACDLGRPEIRRVFSDARQRLADCHSGTAPLPTDSTDQYFLNWAVKQQLDLFRSLPFRMNFFKLAVTMGDFPHFPADIVGLHAAGVPLPNKLDALRQQAAVLGCARAEAY
jgi:hypothetical protein